MAMKTKAVRLTAPQEEYLKIESRRLGITVGDLIRRIVDAHREREAAK